jgi:hypothetical protein
MKMMFSEKHALQGKRKRRRSRGGEGEQQNIRIKSYFALVLVS